MPISTVELRFPDEQVSRAAIERAIQKLPIKARFVTRAMTEEVEV